MFSEMPKIPTVNGEKPKNKKIEKPSVAKKIKRMVGLGVAGTAALLGSYQGSAIAEEAPPKPKIETPGNITPGEPSPFELSEEERAAITGTETPQKAEEQWRIAQAEEAKRAEEGVVTPETQTEEMTKIEKIRADIQNLYIKIGRIEASFGDVQPPDDDPRWQQIRFLLKQIDQKRQELKDLGAEEE